MHGDSDCWLKVTVNQWQKLWGETLLWWAAASLWTCLPQDSQEHLGADRPGKCGKLSNFRGKKTWKPRTTFEFCLIQRSLNVVSFKRPWMLPVSHYENDDEDCLYYFKSGSPLVVGLCSSESTSWFYVCVCVRIYTHTHTSTLTCVKNRINTDNTPISHSVKNKPIPSKKYLTSVKETNACSIGRTRFNSIVH